MKLLVDIGNSRIKYATHDDGVLATGVSYPHGERTLVEVATKSFQGTPESIYMISVASSAIEQRFIDDCVQMWGLTPSRLVTGSRCEGITNGYRDPAKLGVDRWAALVAAYKLVQGALVVIDCGTACSADVVDANGRHLGGAIVPGMQMMQQALQQGTARIQVTAGVNEVFRLGTTTDDCINYGVVASICGFIDRVVQMATRLVGEAVTVVITGGDAPRLLSNLPATVIYEKDLVLQGVAVMVAEQASGSCK